MKLERFDVAGGLMQGDVLASGRIWMTVCERFDTRKAQAHILETDDAVAVAHWLLRCALRLGDTRPEVLSALGALQNLADREEAQSCGT